MSEIAEDDNFTNSMNDSMFFKLLDQQKKDNFELLKDSPSDIIVNGKSLE